MINPETAALVARLTKLPDLTDLFASTETEWAAVAQMQNTLPGGEAERFMMKILGRCDNAGAATVEDRVACFISIKRRE